MEKYSSQIIPHNEVEMLKAADYIRKGKLVAFPTETVYGLGANALDSAAASLVFKTKERPMNDPLIVHVDSFESAMKLLDIDENLKEIYKMLTDKYWPGPLTIVAKANDDIVPSVITASTGFVGIRCPDNEIAQELIRRSGLPIAAPSANKFGHVSPTKPTHVLSDFAHNDVLIIDGGPCSFGIESTVAKLFQESPAKYLIHIFRKGGVSEESLNETIGGSELGKRTSIRVEARQQIAPNMSTKEALAEDAKPKEAPGMMLKHYSPRIDTFIIKCKPEKGLLKDAALIDFARIHEHTKDEVKWYKDLSEKGDVKEAIGNIYEYLRQAEASPGIKQILLINMNSQEVISKITLFKEHLDALYDRMLRAAAGRVI
eukprot:TRINITY_DN1634_c0_g2_i6.p2 TRINITY_DN1634_c0_g2~~TRINITY_DN1634_c0_g2_i6.p2  ORF type:complete len:373 (-),score=97.25 TRINITY_DN1634_c0_g2_i6:1670-2788(-)